MPIATRLNPNSLTITISHKIIYMFAQILSHWYPPRYHYVYQIFLFAVAKVGAQQRYYLHTVLVPRSILRNVTSDRSLNSSKVDSLQFLAEHTTSSGWGESSSCVDKTRYNFKQLYRCLMRWGLPL